MRTRSFSKFLLSPPRTNVRRRRSSLRLTWRILHSDAVPAVYPMRLCMALNDVDELGRVLHVNTLAGRSISHLLYSSRHHLRIQPRRSPFVRLSWPVV